VPFRLLSDTILHFLSIFIFEILEEVGVCLEAGLRSTPSVSLGLDISGDLSFLDVSWVFGLVMTRPSILQGFLIELNTSSNCFS
jgi:hypothetical protein